MINPRISTIWITTKEIATPIFGLLLDLEGHRAKGLQVRHTLSTSYSALVGQLFQPN